MFRQTGNNKLKFLGGVMDEVVGLLEVMARLRDPVTGCPWDREQTVESIVRHTIEEAYEVADAAERGSMSSLRDELGDLLFQVVFISRIAEERGEFNFPAVCAGLVEKLIRRHPHVFGEGSLRDSDSVANQWEDIKALERSQNKSSSPFDGIPPALPALTRAMKVQSRAARYGYDWQELNKVVAKLAEELGEFQAALRTTPPALEQIEAELGDVLFTCVNVARHLRVDPESSLRRTVARFERRVEIALKLISETGRPPSELSPTELDRYWEQAKTSLQDPKSHL